MISIVKSLCFGLPFGKADEPKISKVFAPRPLIKIITTVGGLI